MGRINAGSIIVLLRLFSTTEIISAFTAQIRTDEAIPPAKEHFQPSELSHRFFSNSNSTIINLLFTADTQYYYQCTPGNTQCLRVCDLTSASSSETDCEVEQNRWANRVQRQSIGSLIAQSTGGLPDGLVINGDLTHHGHLQQLTAFKNQWLDLEIPLFPGLGNHDYENNVDDCVLNHCANRMLFWFVKYADSHNFAVDYSRTLNGLTAVYNGSFAYSTDICNKAPKDSPQYGCVHLVQLHNRPNYEVSFEATLTQWNVNRSWTWLTKDLASTSYPIIINLHNYDDSIVSHLERLLTEEQSQWANRVHPQSIGNHGNRILAVLYGHHHSRWGLDRERCLGGQAVPFLFVGSVPNNRYLSLSFDTETSTVEFFNFHAFGNHTTEIEVQKRRQNVCTE